MNNSITLNNSPRIEIQLLESGFQFIDERTEHAAGYYAYQDVQGVELNRTLYPRLASWLRYITWLCNGVPFFPDAATCKKSNLIIHLGNTKIGLWLTDRNMVKRARAVKNYLESKA